MPAAVLTGLSGNSHRGPPFTDAMKQKVSQMATFDERARGLVEQPADWRWSSFRHYLTGEDAIGAREGAESESGEGCCGVVCLQWLRGLRELWIGF
jgi:hypothetical protein